MLGFDLRNGPTFDLVVLLPLVVLAVVIAVLFDVWPWGQEERETRTWPVDWWVEDWFPPESDWTGSE